MNRRTKIMGKVEENRKKVHYCLQKLTKVIGLREKTKKKIRTNEKMETKKEKENG